jgi:hypothetical protein
VCMVSIVGKELLLCVGFFFALRFARDIHIVCDSLQLDPERIIAVGVLHMTYMFPQSLTSCRNLLINK